MLDVAARDAKGAPLAGLAADARLAHPTDERLDHVVPLRPAGAGSFRGAAPAQAGQWDLVIELYRGEARVFRSRSRVALR